jgi:hypothetical protein
LINLFDLSLEALLFSRAFLLERKSYNTNEMTEISTDYAKSGRYIK